jgi:hypothetical protein
VAKGKNRLGLFLFKIADGARMAFSSVRHRRSARTAFRPRNNAALKYGERDLSRHV